MKAVGYIFSGYQYCFGGSIFLCRRHREHDWHYLINEMQLECPYRLAFAVTSEQQWKQPRGEAENVSQPRARKCTPQNATEHNVQTTRNHPCPGMVVTRAIPGASLLHCEQISTIYGYTTGSEGGLSQPLLT
jgi:hypothetical protein